MFIFRSMIAFSLWMTSKEAEHQYDLGFNGQCQIYLKYVVWFVTRTPFSMFDGDSVHIR